MAYARSRPSPRQGATRPVRADLRRQVRDALAHLDDLAYLQTHPLAAMVPEAASDRRTGTGSLLRQTLLEAIESLRPDPRTSVKSPARRRHAILALRYVEGINAQSIQTKLAIGRSEYYKEHQDAIRAVTALLRERWLMGEDVGVLPAVAGRAERPDPHPFPEEGGNEPPPVRAPGSFRLHEVRRSGPRLALPVPLTGLIGREAEMAAARQLLAAGRLVTLTGPPGTGKTRLAIELAREADGQFADGVFFVDLASIGNAELVLPSIARMIEIDAEKGRIDERRSIRERLVAELQLANALLVLDNYEQVVEAGPALADLLQHCPGVTALVTSRVPLRVRGEHEMIVPPVDLPAAIHDIDAARAGDSSAVQLFVERARGVRADFKLTDGNAPAVAELCARLDGLPLALELAAARSDVLTPEGILARLDSQLLLSEQGPSDLPPRQRTLKAAIAWSYDLLDEEARALFRRLAVFSGGWSLESASAVTGRENVVDAMSALVRSSLVQRRTPSSPAGEEPALRASRGGEDGGSVGSDQQARFGMLETVRAYGLEQLAAAGERERFSRRHAEYFYRLIESSGWMGTRPLVQTTGYGSDPTQQPRWDFLRRAGEEESNHRAAFGWAVQRADGAKALWLAAGLAALGFHRGHPVDERPQLQSALGLPGAQGATPARAVALNLLGELAGLHGDTATARALLIEELEIEQELGDKRAIGFALNNLRRVAGWEDQEDEARAWNEQALRIFREIGDPLGLANALTALGQQAMMDDDLPTARAYFEESLSISRNWPTTCYLGVLATEQGKLDEARQCLEEFLQLSQVPFDPRLAANALDALGGLAVAEGQSERAFRLAGAAAALRAAWRIRPRAWLSGRFERGLAPAAATLDEPARAAAWAEGQAMTAEEAVRYALTGGRSSGSQPV